LNIWPRKKAKLPLLGNSANYFVTSRNPATITPPFSSVFLSSWFWDWFYRWASGY